MSRLLIRSVTAISRTSINNSVFLIARPLGTDVQTNFGQSRHNQSLPPPSLLTTTNRISSRDIRISLDQNNQQPNSEIKDYRLVLSSEQTKVESLKDNKDFIANDGVVDKQNKANLEQLTHIADAMTYHLPRFFTTPHPFNLYTPDIILLDNTKQVRVQGTQSYAMRVALIKLYFAMSYSSNNCEVLNLVKHPEESCVRIRWRVVSKPGLVRFALNLGKRDNETWTDGVSTLYVNNDGKIYCHVRDNIDVDESKTEIKKTIKSPLVDRGLNV